MLRGKDNVVQLLDFFYSIDDKQRIIQNTVLEFCDMSLEQVLGKLDTQKEFLPMTIMKNYLRQIFNGINNMHELNISHRDLKPENILIKDNFIKICDVGSSKVLDMSEKRMNTPYVVSRYYRAPELILACHKYDHSIDIWAIGCILFELLAKTPMFPGDSEGIQILEFQQILGPPNEYEMSYYKQHLIENNVNELFSKITRIDRNKKLDILTMLKCSEAYTKKNIYAEQDLADAADLIEKCLKWIPQDRISAKQAMDHPFCQLSEE
jgi:serine/threonine protein kinase